MELRGAFAAKKQRQSLLHALRSSMPLAAK
jgi:hypothetical protein